MVKLAVNGYFCLYLSCFACGCFQEENCDSVGILAHRVNFLQLVLVAAVEQWIWIKICNLKDGGHGDKDRDIWERRGDIIIIRASSFAHKPKLSPHHPPPTHTKLPLVRSHTHYACKAFIVCPGCGPEDPSPTDWAGWRVKDRQRRVPPPSPLFEINHTGFHIQCPPPSSPCQQWQWAWASSPAECLRWIVSPPLRTSPTLDTLSLSEIRRVKLLLEEDHMMSSRSLPAVVNM